MKLHPSALVAVDELMVCILFTVLLFKRRKVKQTIPYTLKMAISLSREHGLSDIRSLSIMDLMVISIQILLT